MLPDTSSITTRRMRCGVLSKIVIGCGLPSSRISKLSRVRSGTSWPSRLVTVANTRTASLEPRKIGSCAAIPRTADAHKKSAVVA